MPRIGVVGVIYNLLSCNTQASGRYYFKYSGEFMVHLIEDLAVLLLVSLPINLFFHKIKLPSVMGYLIAGVLIGPYGLKLISDVHSVKELAEIGVILLRPVP